MAADGAFFPALSRLHPRYGTPSAAIFLQSAWAIALTISGGYDGLVNSVVFADWIFFGLTVAGLFVLRPRLSRAGGYRTPGYPWLPACFVIAAAFVVYSSISTARPLRRRRRPAPDRRAGVLSVQVLVSETRNGEPELQRPRHRESRLMLSSSGALSSLGQIPATRGH